MFGGEEGFHFPSQQIKNKKIKLNRLDPGLKFRVLFFIPTLSGIRELPSRTLTAPVPAGE